MLLDPAQSIRVPGRLVKDPTDVGAAFPHGGTELGLVEDIIFQPGLFSRRNNAQEHSQTAEVVIGKGTAVLGCFTEGLDDNMIETVFPETFVGGSSGKRGMRMTTATRSAILGSSLAIKLLFSPRDPANHPALVIYKAVPVIDDESEIALNVLQDTGAFLFFIGLRDATGRSWEMQRLEDITL